MLTRLCEYICDLFFSDKNVFFLIFSQNIDCGFSFEPPHSNEYPYLVMRKMDTPVKPSFTTKRGSNNYPKFGTI